jgi:hypothetical protein
MVNRYCFHIMWVDVLYEDVISRALPSVVRKQQILLFSFFEIRIRILNMIFRSTQASLRSPQRSRNYPQGGRAPHVKNHRFKQILTVWKLCVIPSMLLKKVKTVILTPSIQDRCSSSVTVRCQYIVIKRSTYVNVPSLRWPHSPLPAVHVWYDTTFWELTSLPS